MLTDAIPDCPVDIGRLILSPTRTYAPVIKAMLEEYRENINALIHCSGGAQTKVLHFTKQGHVVKDNLFDIPILFKIIQEESHTEWKEMYKVFNMGHRMEIYVDEKYADDLIAISKSFGIDARIIGHVEPSSSKSLTIMSQFGEFKYN
jgi:phosphoribosylformylglycinamidine cyclo-ligase